MSENIAPARVAAIIVSGIVAAALAFVLYLFLVKLLWAWVIPDLFPGAVDQGLIAREISWYTALKVAIFLALLTAFLRAGVSHRQDGG